MEVCATDTNARKVAVNIRLEVEAADALKRRAKRNERTVAAEARLAIRAWLEMTEQAA